MRGLDIPPRPPIIGGKDPFYVYNSIAYAKIVDGSSIEKINKLRVIFESATDEADLSKKTREIGEVPSSMRRWGYYRKKNIDLNRLLRPDTQYRSRPQEFRFLPGFELAYAAKILGGAKTFNPKNNNAIHKLLRPNYSLSPIVEINMMKEIGNVIEKYNRTIPTLKITGMTKRIPNPAFSNLIEVTEDLRQRLREKRNNTLEDLDECMRIDCRNPTPDFLLETAPAWTNTALNERNNRWTNLFKLWILRWYSKNVSRYSVHFQRQGWTTSTGRAEGARNTPDVFINAMANMNEKLLFPTIKVFQDEILDKMDGGFFCQTIQEAKEITLEYLHYRLFYSLKNSEPSEEVLDTIEVLRSMMYSFPYAQLKQTLKDFVDYYRNILPIGSELYVNLERIAKSERTYFDDLYDRWHGVTEKKKADSLACNIWIDKTDAEIEENVSRFLDVIFADRLTTLSDSLLENKIYQFFYLYVGTVAVQEANPEQPMAESAITLVESRLYDIYIDMMCFANQDIYETIKKNFLIPQMVKKLGEWFSKISPDVIKESPSLFRSFFIGGNTAFPAYLGILDDGSDAIQKRIYNIVNTIFSDFLGTIFEPYLFSISDRVSIDNARKCIGSWFYPYVNDPFSPWNTFTQSLDELKYSIYANQQMIDERVIPEFIDVSENFDVMSIDTFWYKNLAVTASFVTKDADTLVFEWFLDPGDKNRVESLLETTMGIGPHDLTQEYPASFHLSYPFRTGRYYCVVTCKKTDAGGRMIELTRGKSISTTLNVYETCIRCNVKYLKDDSYDTTQFDPVKSLMSRHHDSCEWFIDAKKYLLYSKSYRWNDRKFYSFHTILDEWIKFIIFYDSDDINKFAVLEEIGQMPIRLKSGEDANEEDEGEERVPKKARFLLPIVDREAIYNKRTRAKYDPKMFGNKPMSIVTIMDAITNTLKSFQESTIAPERKHEILKEQIYETYPYKWLLEILLNLCRVGIIDPWLQKFSEKPSSYFNHFSDVLSRLSDYFYRNSLELTREKEFFDRTSDHIDSSTIEKKLAEKNRQELPTCKDLKSFPSFFFDEKGFEENAARIEEYSKNVYPTGNQDYRFLGRHDPTNILPDPVVVFVKEDGEPIFFGLEHDPIAEDYDPVGDGMKVLFKEPRDLKDDSVEDKTLALQHGSIRFSQRSDMDYLLVQINTTIETINKLVKDKRDRSVEYNIKYSVQRNLEKLLFFTKEYNNRLIS